MPSDYPLPRLGMGAFRLALEAVYKVCHLKQFATDPKATTGAELPYTQFGKPYESTYTFADKMLIWILSQLGKVSPEHLVGESVG
jgi:ribonucleotide monophosphatase NagD (HAD superfamily)